MVNADAVVVEAVAVVVADDDTSPMATAVVVEAEPAPASLSPLAAPMVVAVSKPASVRSEPKAGAKVVKTERSRLEDSVLTVCRSGDIGNVQLAPGEAELRRWDLDIKVFNPRDKLLNALSLGIYGLMNRSLGLRKRRVLLTLTDRRLLLKETFFQRVPAMKEEYWEGQQSLNLRDLAYVRYESGAGGLFDPAYLVCDLHFFQYPEVTAPSLYESWGSMFFRPFVDCWVVALDKATGGLYTRIRELKKQSIDPMALLQAMVDAQEQASSIMANPLQFLVNVLYYFLEEVARRIQQWLNDMFQLFMAIMMGLVPIATLPALLRLPDDPQGQDANVMSLKMYKDDDPHFVQNVEGFLSAVVAARDALVRQQLPTAPAAAVAVDPAVPLPPFMYSFVTGNAQLQFAAPLKPFMRGLDKVYCLLSAGIYYITDLQGILQHSGGLVMTSKSVSTSSVKLKWGSKEVDHARLDVWFMSDIQVHALDTKWDVLNDKKKMLTVGATHGTVLMDITFLQNQEQQDSMRHLLSVAMNAKVKLDVPASATLPPDIHKYITASILKKDETVLSIWQCKAGASLLGKLLSLGLAETAVSTCSITDSRLVYKTTGVNCRGKRKEWELSVPLNVVESVLWANYYQKCNKIYKVASSIPVLGWFRCCCTCCPLMEDSSDHFWMGPPGVTVSIVLGKQKRYGATMQGKGIWFCVDSHDAVMESINNLNLLQYENGQYAPFCENCHDVELPRIGDVEAAV